MKITIQDYQKRVYKEAQNSLLIGHTAPLVVMPTGSGKTFTFSMMVKSAQDRGKIVYVLSPRRNITSSIAKSFKKFGIDFGIVQPGFTQLKKSVQICSAYSTKKILSLPSPDLLIIDEGHHATASIWLKIIEAWPLAKIIGFTATPVRGDGQGLGIEVGGVFDDLILGPDVRELIDRGERGEFGLAPYDYFRGYEDINLSEVGIKGNDFDESLTRDIMLKKEIIGSTVDQYLDLSRNLPALAFCVSVEASEKTASEFRARGVRARSLTGNDTPAQQEKMIAALGDGSLDVITSCQIISEGTDIPVCNTMLDLAPTWSLGLSQQRRGRVLRWQPNKRAIIIDPVNNWTRTWFPCTPHEWDLNQKRVQRKKGQTEDIEIIQKTRQCEGCQHVHQIQPTCPRCGHVYSTRKELEQVNGHLVRVDPEELRRIKKKERQEQGMAKTLDELLEIEKKRGYKKGWARNVFKSKQKKMRGF